MHSDEVRSFRGNVEAHLMWLTALSRADLIAAAPPTFDELTGAAAKSRSGAHPSALSRFLSTWSLALSMSAFTAFVMLYVAGLLMTWDEYDPFWNCVGLVTMGLLVVFGGAVAFFKKFKREGDE